ncbi:exodeoxyribonuclease VII small subunit [Aestuariimicrobium soli]|uniref:exodeoxyribonuclease VII small subunit n=1 Tax=Aestuariimicrobium soli TaxID=2035834 RepID=UPI003EBFD980
MTDRTRGSADPGQATEPTYEEARTQLAEVVRQLESGGVSLNDSMKLWERGEELAGICQRMLDGAKAKVEAARAAAAGSSDAG